MNKSLYRLLFTLCLSISVLSLSAVPQRYQRKNNRAHRTGALYKAALNKRKKGTCPNGLCALRPKKAAPNRNKKAARRKVAARAALRKQALNKNENGVAQKNTHFPQENVLKQPLKGILKPNNNTPKQGPAKKVRFSSQNQYSIINPVS